MENQINQKSDHLPKVSNRHLTVSSCYSELKSVSQFSRKSNNVPFIRLCGKWLRDIGFETGDKIQVTPSKNLIIIKLENNNLK